MLLKHIVFCSNTGSAKLCLSCFLLLSLLAQTYDFWIYSFRFCLAHSSTARNTISKQSESTTITHSSNKASPHQNLRLGCPIPFIKDTFSHQVNTGLDFIYYFLLLPFAPKNIPFFFFLYASSYTISIYFLGRFLQGAGDVCVILKLSKLLLLLFSQFFSSPGCKDSGSLLLLWSICCLKSVFQSSSGFCHLLKSCSSFLPNTLLFLPLLDSGHSVWFSNT